MAAICPNCRASLSSTPHKSSCESVPMLIRSLLLPVYANFSVGDGVMFLDSVVYASAQYKATVRVDLMNEFKTIFGGTSLACQWAL